MTAAFVVPRDTRLPRVAIVAIYALVLLWAGGEVLRALGRVDAVVFTGYVQVGEAVLQGKDPYGGGLVLINTWPPFFFFVGAGLALLARVSLLGALFLWQVGGLLAIWGCLKLCALLYADGGDTLTFWPRAQDRLAFVSAGVLVPFIMMARLFQEHTQHTQINVQVLFLVLLAFHWFRAGRPALGGGALALAASVKAVPVAFVLYLVYKRAWRETAWTLAFLVLLNLVLPVLVFGPHETAAYWHRWRQVSDAQIAGAASAHYYNQSLLAALKRLLPSGGGGGEGGSRSRCTTRSPRSAPRGWRGRSDTIPGASPTHAPPPSSPSASSLSSWWTRWPGRRTTSRSWPPTSSVGRRCAGCRPARPDGGAGRCGGEASPACRSARRSWWASASTTRSRRGT